MGGIGRDALRLIVLAALVLLGSVTPSAAQKPPALLGIYPFGSLQDSPPGTISSQILSIQAIDAWIASTGKRITIAGDFMDLLFPFPEHNVPAELNAAWDRGYVPFVNVTTYGYNVSPYFIPSANTTQIANGDVDDKIHAWAFEFAKWAQPGKKAFLAVLPEMNGNWTPYYGTPGEYKRAYRHIRAIFDQELAGRGVPLTAASWVFPPNGGSEPGNEFELFYPGGDVVDIVGFSAYNYGGCPADAPWVRWETYDLFILPFLNRMRAMAPHKPIFLSQVATVEVPVHGVGDKDVWLDDTYTKLASYPNVRGVVYYNVDHPNPAPNCPNGQDFRVHDPSTNPDRWEGFRTALGRPGINYGYYAPGGAALNNTVFARPPQIFLDVEPVPPLLAGEGLADFSPWIHTLAASGITTGCGGGNYCPNLSVTRTQMAAFLVKGIHGAGFVPPPAQGNIFTDVPASAPLANFIEQLFRDGITGGCGASQYCPDNSVTRAQMAIFLLRAKHGAQYAPPPASGTVFNDVPAQGNAFAPWIEQLAAEGITGGCGGGNYCPNSAVTREQMAVFLVRTYDL